MFSLILVLLVAIPTLCPAACTELVETYTMSRAWLGSLLPSFPTRVTCLQQAIMDSLAAKHRGCWLMLTQLGILRGSVPLELLCAGILGPFIRGVRHWPIWLLSISFNPFQSCSTFNLLKNHPGILPSGKRLHNYWKSPLLYNSYVNYNWAIYTIAIVT